MRLTPTHTVSLWAWIAGCALLVVACGRAGISQEGAGEEAKTAQVTVWGDRFEIFLEHRLVIVNTPTKFITHVTDLTTLEPRREGPLTVTLRQGSEAPITHVEPTPARDGIYTPELTFPKPGGWIVSLRIPSAVQEYVVELPPLTVFATREEIARAPNPAAPEGISFLKEQQWKLLTKTEPVHRRQIIDRLRLPGVVSVRPGNRAAVTPPIAGHLMPPPGTSLLSLGARTKAGQVLAMVQPHLAGSDLVTFLSSQQQLQALEVELTVKAAAAEAEAIRARVAFNHAEQALRRIRALREQNAKSVRELEEAEFAQRKAEADLSAAEALRKTYERAKKQLADRPRSVDLDHGIPAVELKAPIAGTIVAVNATVGEHVHSDAAMFTILNIDTVLIEAQIPEANLGRLGTIVDPKTRTVALVYEVPNPDGRLRIGMALNVYVETARVEEALVVPVSALVDEDGRAIAFVQVSGETFEKRDLTLGIRDGELEGKRLEIRRHVQSAFATVLQGERVIQARAEDVRIAENGVAVAKARLAAGDAIPAEVGQAEVELGQARLALEQTMSRRTQAIEALVTAIGDPTLHVESLEGSLDGSLALPPLESLATRLAQSPFIGAAEADIAVQQARIELAETQRIRDVSLDLLYRRVGDVENTVDVGVRVPIPLFNRYQGRIREARADFVAAEARARSARNELARELQTSYRTLATAIAAAKLLREEILPRAENVLRSAETRYASGDISLTELLPIRRDWTRVRLDYLDALQDVMQAWAALSPYLY